MHWLLDTARQPLSKAQQTPAKRPTKSQCKAVAIPRKPGTERPFYSSKLDSAISLKANPNVLETQRFTRLRMVTPRRQLLNPQPSGQSMHVSFLGFCSKQQARQKPVEPPPGFLCLEARIKQNMTRVLTIVLLKYQEMCGGAMTFQLSGFHVKHDTLLHNCLKRRPRGGCSM